MSDLCCHYPKCELCGGCSWNVTELCKTIRCDCPEPWEYDEE